MAFLLNCCTWIMYVVAEEGNVISILSVNIYRQYLNPKILVHSAQNLRLGLYNIFY